MNITTYKGRLIAIYSLITFFFIFGLLYAVYLITLKEINTLPDTVLLQMAKERISEFKSNPEKYSATEAIEVIGKTHYKIIKTDTGTLLKSVGMPEEQNIKPDFFQQVMQKRRIYETVKTATGSLRVLYVAADDKHIIKLTLPLIVEDELLVKARNIFISMVTTALFVSFIIGWILASRAVKPVVKVTEEAYKIASKNLSDRLNVKAKGIEFSNLIRAFNSILDRIEWSIENQKRFASDLSHEIRSPLTAIKGNIEVTLRRRRNTEEYEETLKTNLGDIDRTIRLVNNHLFIVKADTGVIELNPKEFNLSHLIEKIILSKKNTISEKIISVITELDNLLFYGDEILISQLFSNLLDNAIRYTPKGGDISIYATKGQDGLTLSVQDTGSGIPPNEVEKVFERFYRGRENINMHETGSGLGLYICRWITEAHGGKISLQSQLGKGSTFNVYLPFYSATFKLLQ
ncbi:MAG: HAMP domain-containing protein [Nitrospirae bacterium]|nr:HAMP domain-containing protein [Nitrospirota bacterium]